MSRHIVSLPAKLEPMPRLWTETIHAHREAVRDATLDSAAQLVSRHGLRSVTMGQVAAAAGIGRATLYKYFPDLEAILAAWHRREIRRHLDLLASAAAKADGPARRLEAVLRAYAHISSQFGGHPDQQLSSFLHQDSQLDRAGRQLRRMIAGLIGEAATAGAIRADIGADELAEFCLHALAVARQGHSAAAIDRVVGLTLDALRHLPASGSGRGPGRSA
jgi:AcrR family transcriptional regulator